MKKHKYMENLSLKVIALFFAVFLWLIVINIDDPVDTQTFDNIPVEVKNEQVKEKCIRFWMGQRM